MKGYAKTSDLPTPGLDEAAVKGLIEDALKGYAKTSDLPTPGLDEAAVKKLIADALKGYAKTTDIPASLTKEEIIEIIKETIETTESDVTTVYLTEVTSLSADQVVNPMFTFNTPFDVKANILLAYFGEKAKRDIYFPRGAEEPIVWKGDYIIEGTGNAGKLYVTVNPSSVDFSGKTLKLMYTGGDEAPVELTPLEASNKNLMFLSRGENAFYGCEKLETLIIRGDFMWEQSWLDHNPFYNTNALSVIKNSNPNFKVENGMLMSADGKILFRCVNENKRVVIKDGVETITQGAFCGRDRMEEVVLPTSLRIICNDAFSGCDSIDNVVLPEGVETLGIESFSFCSNLKTMTLPSTLKKIAYSAFAQSDHLQNFVYPKGMEEEFKIMISDAKYELPF